MVDIAHTEVTIPIISVEINFFMRMRSLIQ